MSPRSNLNRYFQNGILHSEISQTVGVQIWPWIREINNNKETTLFCGVITDIKMHDFIRRATIKKTPSETVCAFVLLLLLFVIFFLFSCVSHSALYTHGEVQRERESLRQLECVEYTLHTYTTKKIHLCVIHIDIDTRRVLNWLSHTSVRSSNIIPIQAQIQSHNRHRRLYMLRLKVRQHVRPPYMRARVDQNTNTHTHTYSYSQIQMRDYVLSAKYGVSCSLNE